MDNKSKVSVLLATYKGSHFIKRAIQSVLAQSFTDYVLMIIDDSPNDDTFKVVKEFKGEERIIYLRNEKRLGFRKSLNRGIHEARSEYIARIDDDDVWLDEDKLKKQVGFLDTHPEYVLVGTGVVGMSENGAELSRSLMPEHDDEIRERMLSQNCFIHSSVIFRKSVAMNVGGYKETKHRCSEDYDLWLKLGTKGKLANLPTCGVTHTARNRGFVFNLKAEFIPTVKDINVISKYKEIYPHYRQAVRLRLIQCVNLLLCIVTDVRPLIHAKRYAKHKILSHCSTEQDNNRKINGE